MQLYIFLICLFCGVVSGGVYDVLFVARSIVCGVNAAAFTVKDRIFIIICDLIYCLVFAAGFIFVSVMFGFGDLRLYMLIGCALGAFIYLKSLHIIVAFLINKVYNVIATRRSNGIDRGKT